GNSGQWGGEGGVKEWGPGGGGGAGLATIGIAAGRETAYLRFFLERPALVTLETLISGQGVATEQTVELDESTVRTRQLTLKRGWHELQWEPDILMPPRTYRLRVTAEDKKGTRGRGSAVVRLLGVDAAFDARSTAPETTRRLSIATDANALTFQMLRCGPEKEPTYANDLMRGEVVSGPIQSGWQKNGNRPG